MKMKFFSAPQPHARKNDLCISLITHDLDSAYTLPTPKNSLCTLGGRVQEVKAP